MLGICTVSSIRIPTGNLYTKMYIDKHVQRFVQLTVLQQENFVELAEYLLDVAGMFPISSGTNIIVTVCYMHCILTCVFDISDWFFPVANSISYS